MIVWVRQQSSQTLQEKTMAWIFVIENKIRDLLFRIWQKLCKIHFFCLWSLIVFIYMQLLRSLFLGPLSLTEISQISTGIGKWSNNQIHVKQWDAKTHSYHKFHGGLVKSPLKLQHGWVITSLALRWRHNGRDSVSNHQPHDCLLNRLFRRRLKKTSKLRVTDLCAGNSPGTGEFPAQMASNAENVSIWWRHHGKIN